MKGACEFKLFWELFWGFQTSARPLGPAKEVQPNISRDYQICLDSHTVLECGLLQVEMESDNLWHNIFANSSILINLLDWVSVIVA